jgi:hypothetical protein
LPLAGFDWMSEPEPAVVVEPLVLELDELLDPQAAIPSASAATAAMAKSRRGRADVMLSPL